jgi:hypothetical protein
MGAQKRDAVDTSHEQAATADAPHTVLVKDTGSVRGVAEVGRSAREAS